MTGYIIAEGPGQVRTTSDVTVHSVLPSGCKTKEPPVDVNALHAKIGELTLENNFLKGALTKAGGLSAKR